MIATAAVARAGRRAVDGAALVLDVLEHVVHDDDVGRGGVHGDVEEPAEVHVDAGRRGRRRAAWATGSGSHASTRNPAAMASSLNSPLPQPMLSSVRPSAGPSQRSVMSYFARAYSSFSRNAWSSAVYSVVNHRPALR